MVWGINFERLLTAQSRAENYFINTPYFSHFVELCVLSYPSPLEESAPAVTKIFLFLIAGFFEYLAAATVADITDIYFKLCGDWLNIGPKRPGNALFEDNDVGYERIIFSLFALRFATRARAFFRQPLRRGGRVRLHDVVISSFWFNPALIFHVVLRALSYCFAFIPLRFGPLYLFWCLFAPSSEIPTLGLATWLRTEDGREKIAKVTKGDFSFWYITKCTISTIFLEKVVTNLPFVTIHITLFAQGLVFYSATWPKTRSALGEKAERILKQLPEPLLQQFESAYMAVEWLLFLLANAIRRCALTILRILSTSITLFASTCMSQRKKYQSRKMDETLESSDKIRLLRVLPALSTKEPIICELQWHAVANPPKYRAISYSWGNPAFVYEISVDEKPVKITRSAQDVLQNIRSSWKTEAVWIDAICIDQSSNEDKAQQIPLMPLIYQNAAEVIVWLGPSKRAVLATELVNRVFLANRLSSSSQTRFTYQIPKEAARALKIMLSKQWFERCWVVQEVVAAKKTRVTVRYGNESLSWQRLSWFTDTISRDPALLSMLSERIGYSGLEQATALRNANVVRRFSFLRSEKEPLSLVFYLIQMFRLRSRFKATEVKDRIYALQGLSGAKPSLVPQYEKSLRDIFIDVARNAATTSPPQNQLDFLPHAGLAFNSKIPNLPSWTPDWSLDPPTLPLLGCEGAPELLASPQLTKILDDIADLESFNSTAPIPGEKPPKVIALEKAINNKDQLSLMLPNATLNTIPKITFLENDILLLHGRILGPITAVGTIFPRYTPETWILTLHRLADWSALARTHYTPSSPAAQTAIWQTFLTLLIQNRSSTVPLDFTFTNPFTSPDPAMLAPFAQFQLDVILAAGVKASNEEADKAFRAFCEVASMGCTGRCFAVVGACVMGLVGEGVRVGDLVVVVDGCRVPLVLRWVADGLWELVGPAYVQGFMGGEGMGGGFVEMDFRVR
ncbi:hypothetical protein GLAREA_11589 [Glarea lozoyensis ATCC 20868]|uniref:Heterokaryon incompatibility domain-containing protein n=1 Tax=Glarea lozoyensis (strain ATCC 20868 / MF5171) TaxID=1116229 RepID=S3DEB9_GLAL2|nr:uncharacterized protein GLAREA_11589 [Glarea lozoyensis ATCC 20868]EPE25008.1 hypothetical protein GLAREA_11589 [Glarea lozoyensis ATCC 20868]